MITRTPFRTTTTGSRLLATVVAVLLSAAACVLIAGPASAANAIPAGASAASGGRTVTVDLTANGPLPKAIGIHPGDSVQFLNTTHPGVVAVESVSITITGATRSPFTLPPGAAATVGPYNGLPDPPKPIRYTAAYHASVANGLLPAGTRTTAGTINITQDTRPSTCRPDSACPHPVR